MNKPDKDPMLFGDETEQTNYRADVMEVMRKTIEEDRAARRQSSKSETPATLIGGAGLSSGLTQAL